MKPDAYIVHTPRGPMLKLDQAMAEDAAAQFGGTWAPLVEVPEGYRVLKDTTLDERTWHEDKDHENGNYSCLCCECGRMFVGHKRRVVCRSCASE